MPFDAMVVSAAVVVMFLVFAGVLLWGDFKRGRAAEGCCAIVKSAEASEATR